MPYIDTKLKKFIKLNHVANTPGELNFLICYLTMQGYNPEYILSTLVSYWQSKGGNYAAANDVIGAVTCASYELIRRKFIMPSDYLKIAKLGIKFYTRIIIPYEEEKIKSNGDIIDDVLSGSTEDYSTSIKQSGKSKRTKKQTKKQ